MKKLFVLCMTLALLATGCADNTAETRPANQTANVNDVIQQQISQSTGSAAQDETADKQTSKTAGTVMESSEPADIDLTEMSSTMVYSEIYNIISNPQAYSGKKIKIRGSFIDYLDPASGNRYFSCVVQDATACCSQGMEFLLTDDYKYPDDYPADGSEICVMGTFSTYYEGEYMYCTLKDSQLL